MSLFERYQIKITPAPNNKRRRIAKWEIFSDTQDYDKEYYINEAYHDHIEKNMSQTQIKERRGMEEKEITEILLRAVDKLTLETLRQRSITEKMWNRVLAAKIQLCIDDNPIDDKSTPCLLM